MASLKKASGHQPQNRITSLVEVVFVFSAMLAITWVTKSLDLIGAGSIAIWGGIIIATVLMRRRGVSWADWGLVLPKGRREWLVTLGMALGVIVTVAVVMGIVIAPAMEALGIQQAPDASDRFAFFLGRPFAFLGFLIGVIWFGAALGEELFMRGYMLNRLADVFGQNKFGWTMALVVHAVIFGAMHAYQGLAGMIATGVIGFIFGAWYLTGKRRLAPLILAHGIINTIGMVAYYVSDGAIN